MNRPPRHDRLRGCIATILLIATIGGGCHSYTVRDHPASIPADQYDRAFNAAIETLRDKGFEIDREDYRFGRVVSRPLESPTIVEPWHTTNTTFSQMVENTLNTQRRIASVFLDQATDADQYQLRVAVTIERRQHPTRRLTSSTAPRRIFNTLRDVPYDMRQRDNKRLYWHPIARDPDLEQRLLGQIMDIAIPDEDGTGQPPPGDA